MKKRILSILLAVTVALSFMPAASFGAIKADPNHQSNGLDYVKQEMIVYLSECFDYAVDEQEYYAKGVWKAIMDIYNEELERIKNAETTDEIAIGEGEDAVPDFATDDVIDRLTYLGGLTKSKGIKDPDPMKGCIRNVETYKKKVFAQYKTSQYNGWYQDKITDFKTMLNERVADLKKYPTFEGCADVHDTIAFYDKEIDDSPDQTILAIFGLVIEPDNELGIDESKPAYTENELAKDRKIAHKALIKYVNQIMYDYKLKLKPKKKTYNAKKAKLVKRVKRFDTEAKKEPDLLSMLDMYYEAKASVYGLSGMKGVLFPASYGDRNSLLNSIKRLYMSYDQTLYSAKKLKALDEVFSDGNKVAERFSYTKAENKTEQTRVKARNAYVAYLKKQADGIPVKTKELKLDKAKYKKALKNRYAVKGKKKYNQNKVKPILKKAYAAINKCTEPADVLKVSRTYAKKLNNTIRKFNVRTSKKGKGTITKSKTVKYGKNCRVKFEPKAGWKIKRIYVDGKRLKKIRRSYTFKNVKKSHRIKVVFTR